MNGLVTVEEARMFPDQTPRCHHCAILRGNAMVLADYAWVEGDAGRRSITFLCAEHTGTYRP